MQRKICKALFKISGIAYQLAKMLKPVTPFSDTRDRGAIRGQGDCERPPLVQSGVTHGHTARGVEAVPHSVAPGIPPGAVGLWGGRQQC